MKYIDLKNGYIDYLTPHSVKKMFNNYCKKNNIN